MVMFNALTCVICIAVIAWVNTSPLPGHHHHVHHRIYVPQKIKTIHHTKIIKIPEHHHYFHEKEKIIHFETPHHKHDPKLSFKDLEVKLPSVLDHESSEDFSEYHSGGHYYRGKGHNIFKKHAVAPNNHKRRSEEEDDEDDLEEE